MNKDTITVALGDTTKRIEAYLLPQEGLAVHRQLKYVPGKEEHKQTSRWQLTHIHSGTALFRPDECVSTMADAVAIARELKDIDWTQDSSALTAMSSIRDQLVRALEKHSVGELDAEDGEVVPQSRKYVVRKNESAGYDVYDTETETVVMTFIHRGFASEKARELNQGGV